MITGIYAGLCGILLIVLYIRVSQRRLGQKIGAGSGGDTELEQRIRAHANLIESAPLALILLYLFEQTGASAAAVHAYGATFFIARLGHAQGISNSFNRSPGRLLGSIGTLLVLLGLSVVVLLRSFGG
ncbi:MAG: MAPEG family protein [Gammaproteobacteria bacterium]